jgi:hypothetical protein
MERAMFCCPEEDSEGNAFVRVLHASEEMTNKAMLKKNKTF